VGELNKDVAPQRGGSPYSGDSSGKLTYVSCEGTAKGRRICKVICTCGKEYITREDSFKINKSGCGDCPNKYLVEGDIVVLDVSTNKFPNTFTYIDQKMFHKIEKYRWGACHIGKHSSSIYVQANVDGKVVKLHRLLLSSPSGKVIDHISGDTLDNRLDNLRVVDAITNSKNSKRHSNNTSGCSGVSYREYGAWFAYIVVRGHQIGLGNHSSFEEAVTARKAAEVKYNFHPNHGRKN